MPQKTTTKDLFALYEASVQNVKFDVEFLSKIYKKKTGKIAKLLREDFCGTFMLCCEWVKSHPKRQAIGIDKSSIPLRYGKSRHLNKLTVDEQERVQILQQDVQSNTQQCDIIVAPNFSYCIFREREELIRYFTHCCRSLSKNGILVVDIFGGPEAEVPCIDRTKITHPLWKNFTYYWEQKSFNPISREAVFYIHFRFPHLPKIKNAFRYHWRLWTIPELRETMQAAGFNDTVVFWENEKDNDFRIREKADNDPAWLAYVVASKTSWSKK